MILMHKYKRLWLVLTCTIVLVVCAAIGYRMAAHSLKINVEQALGPDSEVGSIHVGWTGVTLEGLRIKGADQWPAEDTLRADHITIVPSLLSLFSETFRIHSVTVNRPYLSVLRTPMGKVLVIPGQLKADERRQESGESLGKPEVAIRRITLRDGQVDIFDASVAKPPKRIHLERIEVVLGHLEIPTLTGRSSFSLSGVVKGSHTDGQVDISGWAEIATRDSSITMHLRSVDLVTLQPYISKAGDTKVRGGTLDLEVRSDVREKRLKAPGRIVISDLELAPSKGMFGTFLGVPRQAVLAFLEDRNNRITLDFTLEGDLDNPRFTLREALSEQLAATMAETLGVSVKGLAEGVGTLGQQGVDAAGEVAKGVGGAIEQILKGK